MAPTRVLIVDDHVLVRRGLQALLENESDMEIAGEASDGATAIALARQHDPDVILLDLTLPGMSGIEVMRSLAAESSRGAVLCVSLHEEHDLVAGMLEAGAAGYVLKSSSVEQLVDAVRIVAGGQHYLSPEIATTILREYRGYRAAAVESSTHLTQREHEVLKLIAEGCETSEIAARLFISPKTVATHRAHIMEKTGLHSIADLTKYAIRRGITTTTPAPKDPAS